MEMNVFNVNLMLTNILILINVKLIFRLQKVNNDKIQLFHKYSNKAGRLN